MKNLNPKNDLSEGRYPTRAFLAELFFGDPLFSQPMDLQDAGVFRRPLRPQDLESLLTSPPLTANDLDSNVMLMAQRALTVIYEQDLVFLPEGGQGDSAWGEFQRFYDRRLREAGQGLRGDLERLAFGWLDDDVQPMGAWTPQTMRLYLLDRLRQENGGSSAVCEAIRSARDPAGAAQGFLIQLSGDLLTEASAMARNVLGNYGRTQSELFTVLIDEYGYGVHATKHSTRFEATLASAGLSPRPHAYWPYFLGSSLALQNYWHYVSTDHRRFFRYLGAVLYAEGTLHESMRQQSAALRAALGEAVDTAYFDEHAHIDVFHAAMALDRVIGSAVERCGERIIPEVVRGFEECALLQGLCDRDLIAHLAWVDGLEARVAEASECLAAGQGGAPAFAVTEPQGEISVPHCHEVSELLVVERGSLEIVAGPGRAVRLEAGQGIVIPTRRLHGSVVRSASCDYRIIGLSGDLS